MKLKKYIQFIKESATIDSLYWLSKDQIKDIFRFVLDEEYSINIDKVFFGYYGVNNGQWFSSDKPQEQLLCFDIDNDDVILRAESYKPGYRITLVHSSNSKGDYTEEFQSAISQIMGEDYSVSVEDSEDKTNIENIHLKDGDIITWIPEKTGKKLTDSIDEIEDGDLYINSRSIKICVNQSEDVKMTEKMLAEVYDWTCDRIEGNSIYCHVDIDDMARSVLSRRDYERWGKMLEEGIDIGDYYGDGYYPDISSVFQYTLNKENEILLIKCLIKELGGLENTVAELESLEIWEHLQNKSEDEVIDILLKERFKRGLEKLSKNSEIMGTVRETIADWERQAHCDANWEELISEFDEVVSEVTEYTKKFDKEVERHYFKKIPGSENKEKVYYKTNVTHYELPFQDKWIEDYGKSLRGYSLDSLFQEWCSDSYQDYKLEPRFSDYGHVDSVSLNKEIASILNHNLKS